MLSEFPHLTSSEFEDACAKLLDRYHRQYAHQDKWQSAELIASFDARYLRVTKQLVVDTIDLDCDPEQDEFEDEDDEVVHVARSPQILIYYDIILSPVYRVPVLYISISDPQHRYPPTMETLYEHLIPPHFRAQAENAGIIGGITIQDHPVTNRPVFFIHPCRTADVMEASVGKRNVTAEEYLITWIGALGKCVGLDVPLALLQ